MTTKTARTAVRSSIVVDAPVDRAFTVFTEGIGSWFPPEYNMLPVPTAERVFEPRVGGRIYDRGEDGSECHWARVLGVRAARTGRLQLGHQPAVADRDRPRAHERGRGALPRGGAEAHARRARAPQAPPPRRGLGADARDRGLRGWLARLPAAVRRPARGV